MNIEINKDILDKLKKIVKLKENGKRLINLKGVFLKKNINKSYYILLVFMVGLASVSVYTKTKKGQITTNIIEESTAPVFSNNNVVDEINIENNVEREIVNELNCEFISVISTDKIKSINYLDGITKIETIGEEKIYNICDGGVVENIYLDYAYGYTVVVRYSDNIKCKYMNLDSDVYVNFGQELKKGDVIGRSIEHSLMEESYIFFKAYYKNESVNINKLLGM